MMFKQDEILLPLSSSPERIEEVLIENIIKDASSVFQRLANFSLDGRVDAINGIRERLQQVSPFKDEPIDCIKWVKNESVEANDYNPNSVAPPEMELLRHSILSDGYTQPIVSWPVDDGFEVIDGFHRTRVAKECKDVTERVHGYVPLVIIKKERSSKNDRMASTIRHNRARGKHAVDSMSDIVVELKRRNWSDDRIMRELGMDKDEILRLFQITGLEELFSNQEFSKAWDVEGEISVDDFEELTDDAEDFDDEVTKMRTVNTSDENRIFHTHDKWECHKAGFYAGSKNGMKKEDGNEAYRAFLADIPRFSAALDRVITEWPNSCEHYLTNAAMNRIAWLGQASVCIDLGIPSVFRGGFSLLEEWQQEAANKQALAGLNAWLERTGRDQVTMSEALSGGRQSDIY